MKIIVARAQVTTLPVTTAAIGVEQVSPWLPILLEVGAAKATFLVLTAATCHEDGKDDRPHQHNVEHTAADAAAIVLFVIAAK